MDFFKKISQYIKLPEMRLFWYFLPLALIIAGVDFFYLDAPLVFWINVAFFLILAFTILFNGLRLAKLNIEIKMERNELSGIIWNLGDGVIAYDQNFRILIFNRSAERIFNMPSGKVFGQIFFPEKAKDPVFSVLGQVMYPSLASVVVRRSEMGEYPQISDFVFNNPRMNLSVTTDKIFDSAGQLLGFVKIIRDRTRETELLRAKSEFIEVAAHQLRTPLTSINWIFQSLAKENLADSPKGMVNMGLEAGANVLKTVNDLLDVSQIESGKFGYKFDQTELIPFIENILSELANFAKENGVKIYLKKPQDLSIPVFIDAQKLSIAFSNLVINAIKYNTKNGEVSVEIKNITDKPYVQISVKDTGIGIFAEDIQRIFTKFFRSDNAKKSVPNGTGLGLYITKNIIDRHGGQILVESQINRGSVFYFTLPLDPKLVPQSEMPIPE